MRLPASPAGYRHPDRPLVVELRDVIGLQARCVACRGRMAVESPSCYPGRIYCLSCDREMAEVVDKLPVTMTSAEWRALKLAEQQAARGKPDRPVGSKNSTPAVRRRPSQHRCMDCRERFVGRDRRRCLPCEQERRRMEGLFGRLVELLHCSEPMRTRHLAAMLGTTPCVIRALVLRARSRGVRIVTVGKQYRLEKAS